MRFTACACLVMVFVAVTANAQDVSTDFREAPTGRYALEKQHSQVLFAIQHEGLTSYHARFDKLSGTLNFDSAEPEKSTVSVIIEMDSVDTPSNELNSTLAGKAVFDAQDFPTATFKSTSIVRTGPNTGLITGDLTIKGVTKPVVLETTFNGGRADPMSGVYVIGFSATASIKRSDFGVTGMVWEPFVGNDVKLTIEAMFQQQKE
ncbi:MAG: YceI family protein [Alphaproteobacteria bacterium]|nr:YceI family protein [Alphaproteobacteria bacterium]MDE2493135.1 YceI family protein [Alphaproteobacteria bacterium]